MTRIWIELGRAARVRRARADGAVWLSGALAVIGCAQNERPDPLADAPGAETARVLTGSIGAPAADAGAAAGLGGGGGGGAGSTAGASGGSPSSGTSVEQTASGALLVHQVYEGTCDPPSVVQWGFFTYRALTPGDSSIAFSVRSAATEAELGDAQPFELLTASTALGTARCAITGPEPCPLDLFVVLGGAPLVHHPVAELEVVLSPASGDGTMPSVEQWRLNYSCTFNQ